MLTEISPHHSAEQAQRINAMNNAAVRIAAAVADKRTVPVNDLARFTAARDALEPQELLS